MPPLPRRRFKLAELLDGSGNVRERRVPCLVASRLQLLGAVPGDAVRLFAVLANEQGCGGVEVTVGDGQRLGRIRLTATAFASRVLFLAGQFHEAEDDRDIDNDDASPRQHANLDHPLVRAEDHVPEIDNIERGNTDGRNYDALRPVQFHSESP